MWGGENRVLEVNNRQDLVGEEYYGKETAEKGGI